MFRLLQFVVIPARHENFPLIRRSSEEERKNYTKRSLQKGAKCEEAGVLFRNLIAQRFNSAFLALRTFLAFPPKKHFSKNSSKRDEIFMNAELCGTYDEFSTCHDAFSEVINDMIYGFNFIAAKTITASRRGCKSE